jgi:hypothetical protein
MNEESKMEALKFFHEMEPDNLPSFRKIIRALEVAKGEKFKISAEEIEKLQARITTERFDGDICITCDNSQDQWCALCDKDKDMCEDCDATDFDCSNSKDKCTTCDEGDHCQMVDTH